MASLQSKGTYWQACFRDHLGKQIQRSTRILVKGANHAESAALKRKATIVASRFEMAARGEVGNPAHFRRVLEEVVELSGGSQVETFGSWTASWLLKNKDRYNASTWSCCQLIVDTLKETIGEQASLESVKPEQIQAYLNQRAKVRASATVVKERKLLSKCFSDAVRSNLLAKNPVSLTVPPKLKSTSRVPFSDKEIDRMLKHADGEWKNVIHAALMTGLRAGDAASLGSEHYDRAMDAIRIVESKTKKSLTIPVASKLRDLLKLPKIAPSIAKLSSGGRNKQFLKIMDAAKIDRLPIKVGKNITYQKSFHSFRHTFISRLANAGVDPEIRQKLAGHSSVEIHEIYTHHNIDRLREAMDKIN